jgi:hypothetical protein
LAGDAFCGEKECARSLGVALIYQLHQAPFGIFRKGIVLI